MASLVYIFFGLLPSVIWLLFYLRKDSHPEPNRMVLKVFFLGAGAAGLAAFLEMGFFEVVRAVHALPLFLANIINIFVGVALIEEALKYMAVRASVFKNPELDEPLDIMLYLIIAALGFAALENILILWFWQRPFYFLETISYSLIRFLGATFLHALCSGTAGYFLAASMSKARNRWRMRAIGLGIAALLHGLYNFSIMSIEGGRRFIIPIVMLVGLAVFVSLSFKKLKRLKSTCLIESKR